MKRALAVFFTLMAFVLITAGCGSNDKGAVQSTESINSKEEVYYISTPYVNLEYPKKWEGIAKIENKEKDNTLIVSFSAYNLPVFDLVFNGNGGTYLGYFIKDGKNITLSAEFYEIKKENEKYQDLAGMQEDVNVIISGLKSEVNFSDSKPQTVTDEVFEIKSDFAKLYYPTKWKSLCDVKPEGNTVSFSAYVTKLFDLVYDGNTGTKLGEYNGKPLMLVSSDIDKSKLSDEEYKNCVAMQEDINVLISKLEEDPKFK